MSLTYNFDPAWVILHSDTVARPSTVYSRSGDKIGSMNFTMVLDESLAVNSPDLKYALEWLLHNPSEERGGHTAITYAQMILDRTDRPV